MTLPRTRIAAGSAPGSGAPALVDEVDADVAQRARAGDRAAFSELYRRFGATVYGVLLSCVPAQDARDQVQEVFLIALRAITELDRPERVGPWLCTIARNRAKDLLRRRRPTEPLDVEPPSPDDDAAESGRAEADEALATLRELPACYAETLTLRLVEGLGGPEIAERTGMTPGSVRVNLHRGMKLLRERLERSRPGDPQP